MAEVALNKTAQDLVDAGLDVWNMDYNEMFPNKLTAAESQEVLTLIESLEEYKKYNAINSWFPAAGEYRRELYRPHMEFFSAGKYATERLFLAGNRCGKSVTAAVEMTFHATGKYPDWWDGKRFDGPVNCYASGKTAKNTRDICQFKLLGAYSELGTGTIPKDCLHGKPTPKPGVPKAYELCEVKHFDVDGNFDGVSTISFKSYDQGMEAFMGTEVHAAWEDEEPPLDVHSETLVRLMTTDGILLLTFTPLEGMTEVVLSYMTAELTPDLSRDYIKVVNCGWDDVPHLTEEQKARLLASTPVHLKEARSKGIPSIGSGAVYPIDMKTITIEPFELPQFYPKAYGMDVGWNRTAVIWGALDRELDIVYLYGEYYKGQEIPLVHAAAIKAPGEWIPGICDAAGANQDDGTKMFEKYIAQGLRLIKADKAVEAGIFEVYQRMVTGRLKIFSTLVNLFAEMRLYQRDKTGTIIKANDHLMDAMRYLIMLILTTAKTKPVGMQGFNRNNLPITGSAFGRGNSADGRWAM